ncbi:hypothetical protein BC781_101616 [Sediminitomix flava]|uniref:Uncharacterized protein n=1 Tax=Sediminitomix flava TaxID=379075 RepID=A0A315ZFA2_SEDFL|nr:hypothetical protein BC781_101616 [Sediminitomix flava]
MKYIIETTPFILFILIHLFNIGLLFMYSQSLTPIKIFTNTDVAERKRLLTQ